MILLPSLNTPQRHVLFYTPDTDECASPDTNECASKALCTNTEGSYLCSCLAGYQGDGENCTGNKTFVINENCQYHIQG